MEGLDAVSHDVAAELFRYAYHVQPAVITCQGNGNEMTLFAEGIGGGEVSHFTCFQKGVERCAGLPRGLQEIAGVNEDGS